MSTVKVGDMTWTEMFGMVKRRLNQLAMCKRGVLQTEMNKRITALGHPPRYTLAEREAINKKMESLLLKAMTPTKSMMKKHRGQVGSVLRELEERAEAIKKDAYVHPDTAKYAKAVQLIKAEIEQRISLLDAEFQEIEDRFGLKITPIGKLPEVLLQLEAREW